MCEASCSSFNVWSLRWQKLFSPHFIIYVNVTVDFNVLFFLSSSSLTYFFWFILLLLSLFKLIHASNMFAYSKILLSLLCQEQNSLNYRNMELHHIQNIHHRCLLNSREGLSQPVLRYPSMGFLYLYVTHWKKNKFSLQITKIHVLLIAAFFWKSVLPSVFFLLREKKKSFNFSSH